MVHRDKQHRRPATHGEAAPSRKAQPRGLAAARTRFDGSMAQSFFRKLKALDFSSQAMLFGPGLLVSVLPFLILLSAFASQRIDDDLALRMGLDPRASRIVEHLFRSSPARLNPGTVTGLLFVAAGTLAVAGSLQQIYEKVFSQDHRGMRDAYRLPIWVAALCAVAACQSLIGRPVRNVTGGTWLAAAVTFAVMTLFVWWTMHFLLAGRVPWRRLLPSAVATGVCFAGLGVFSKFYFSATIIADNKTYGVIGAIFTIMTWLIAIGAVIILGAVAGAVWADRNRTKVTLERPAAGAPGWPRDHARASRLRPGKRFHAADRRAASLL